MQTAAYPSPTDLISTQAGDAAVLGGTRVLTITDPHRHRQRRKLALPVR